MLFLHGYLCDSSIFCGIKKEFEQKFNCYFLDLQGFGKNKNMPYPYCLNDYIRQVKEFMQNNNIKKPCVIAHSFGARIAVKMASQGEFSKIILTGAAGLKSKFSVKKFFKKCIFKILKLFVPKNKLSKFYSADYNALNSIMKQSFIKIVNEHLESASKKVKNKTLIISGENDLETPLYMAKKYNKLIKNSKLIVIKEAGHFCFLSHPKLFCYYANEFLLTK